MAISHAMEQSQTLTDFVTKLIHNVENSCLILLKMWPLWFFMCSIFTNILTVLDNFLGIIIIFYKKNKNIGHDCGNTISTHLKCNMMTTISGFISLKAEHKCTRRWPGSIPTGISNSKCHTWICVGYSHQVTQSHESKTHGFLSTCGSTGT